MATKSKYRELSLGPSEPITRRNSVQGMLVTANYIDPLNNQRMLLLKRVEASAAEPAPKPKVARKRKARGDQFGNTDPLAKKMAKLQNKPDAEPATAFPGSGVMTNG